MSIDRLKRAFSIRPLSQRHMQSSLRILILFCILLGVMLPNGTLAAGADGEVSPRAEELTEFLGLPITNSMVTSWVISLFIIFLFRFAVGKPKLIPTNGQAVVEILIDKIREMIEPIIGKRMVQPTLWLLSSLFIFTLINNWSGLFPGVGTIGYIENEQFVPFIRPGNADLNMTLALALVSMACWLYYIIKYTGLKCVIHDIFGNKSNKSDIPIVLYYFLAFIFFFVGLIEVISILFRPVSLSFRLFGNIYGGKGLLSSISALSDFSMWLLPIPFYFLELLIGLVQALVFVLLVAVYIGLICNHQSDEHAPQH